MIRGPFFNDETVARTLALVAGAAALLSFVFCFLRIK